MVTFKEAINQIEGLASEGKLKDQNVEVVYQDKKYFIHDIDCLADKVLLRVDRSHFIPLGHGDFLGRLKEVNDMVNPSAILGVLEVDKSGDGEPVTNIYCNNNFLEVVVTKE